MFGRIHSGLKLNLYFVWHNKDCGAIVYILLYDPISITLYGMCGSMATVHQYLTITCFMTAYISAHADLGPYCLQYLLPKNRQKERSTKFTTCAENWRFCFACADINELSGFNAMNIFGRLKGTATLIISMFYQKEHYEP